MYIIIVEMFCRAQKTFPTVCYTTVQDTHNVHKNAKLATNIFYQKYVFANFRPLACIIVIIIVGMFVELKKIFPTICYAKLHDIYNSQKL